MEIFKDVKDQEGTYQVSNLGRVKSLKCGKERILKANVDSRGYLYVKLCKDRKTKNRTIHQMVAIAFLDHTPNGHKLVVNHKDFDRKNNKVENLEITTQRNNANKKHLKRSSKYVGVCWYKSSKKWMANIYVNGKRKHLGLFTNELEASEVYQSELKKLNRDGA